MSFSLHFKRSGLRLTKPLSHTWDLQRGLPAQQKRPPRGPPCTGGCYGGSRRTGPSRRTVSRPPNRCQAHLGQERPLRDHRIQPSLCRRAGPEPARSLAANGDAGARLPSPAFAMVPLSWETCFRRSVLSGPGSLSCQYEVKGTRVESQQLGPGGQAAGSSPSAVERSDVNGRR